ncbi:MAG: DnaJ C-terminal domain-containing protein [Pseudomonadota bacterium]
MSADPYSVLGVSRTASDDDIKKAYRAKAKALHPDAHPGDEAKAEAFKRVSLAYDILGDKEKRAQFDRGEIDADGNPRGPFGPNAGFNQTYGGGAQGDVFEDILSGLFGGRGRRSAGPRPGRDVRYRVEVDFADAVSGARRRMVMADGRALDVNIPAGIDTGQTLRLKSQGEASPNGGPPGDALLEVTVGPSDVWRRDGDNLHMTAPVPLRTAVLGGEVDVDTPTGVVSLKVPEGSNTGTALRLRGKGVQRATAPGHLFVRLQIVLDDPKDPDLKAFLRKSKG